MLKSCTYCHRIHDGKTICQQKQAAINARQHRYKENRDIDKFRNSKAWKDKREEIKRRDLYLCAPCLHEGHYTYNNLSVHHAISMEQDMDKRLDNNNLITTCDRHHELMESGKIPIDVVLKIIEEQENRCG